ncbi:hypothetical protein RHGRI_034302 [Rhododendron griersonianum]|uniref:BHLH domain-containing protein n=1 Tax=Rhododendron griersonianum TaxID=479676 RepID=A0AAV6I2X7_9ERIC|nr:hypothetical protein RHGRI_034302 [Rhododendron griersonianum]
MHSSIPVEDETWVRVCDTGFGRGREKKNKQINDLTTIVGDGLGRVEALVEEVPTKQVSSRSSLKRDRAAEFHNLSEKVVYMCYEDIGGGAGSMKKMKALQNLIPNSNKTDKASMLDDAIEYLKQLQLQVQR